MSRKRYESCNLPVNYSECGCMSGNRGSCISLPALVILILILLQFGKKDKCKKDYDDECEEEYDDYDDYEEEKKEYKGRHDTLVDNGILFIIALFFLACCSKKWC